MYFSRTLLCVLELREGNTFPKDVCTGTGLFLTVTPFLMLDSVKSSNLVLKGAINAILEMLEMIEAVRPVESVHEFLSLPAYTLVSFRVPCCVCVCVCVCVWLVGQLFFVVEYLATQTGGATV